MAPKIVVVGSANTDFVVQVADLPGRGETVLGGRFLTARGGKGANQAVAAARLGGEVTFVARLGEDSLGREAAAAYAREGIQTAHLAWDGETPSGVALILVDQNGENMIAVAPGANGRLSPADLQAADAAIREADCILLQLEIPLETVNAAITLARRYGRRVILNPAPAAPLPARLLEKVDILTPNETEAVTLTGDQEQGGPEQAAARLAERTGVRTIVMTLGARGCLVWDHGLVRLIPAFPITPVDTTAAGDAFNGALAVALGGGVSVIEAARYANAAGALAATRPGAQPSLPGAAELEKFLKSVEATDPRG
jgi:ribokinase